MRWTLCLLMLFGCASMPPPDDAVADFTAAFNRLSIDELRPLLAEDATAYLPMPQFGARIDGREAILAALGPLFEAEKARGSAMNLQAKELKVQRTGNVAIATFDVGTSAVFSRRTLVLERRAGGWRIVHLHASNVRHSGLRQHELPLWLAAAMPPQVRAATGVAAVQIRRRACGERT